MLRRPKKVLHILFAVVSLIPVLLTEPSVNTDKSEVESEDPENEDGFHTSVLFLIFFIARSFPTVCDHTR
jgi:hypothetical protein